MSHADSLLLVHVDSPTFTSYHTYDLYPLREVISLRRLIAEDYRLMEDRIHLLRNGVLLSDHDLLDHNDILSVYVSS